MRNDTSMFTVDVGQLGGMMPSVEIVPGDEGLWEIRAECQLPEEANDGSWQLEIRPNFRPSFFYTPHLTPSAGNVIDMHVFRTPCMMMGNEEATLCVLPVPDGFPLGLNRMFMDLDAENAVMTLGITTTVLDGHVLYRRTDRAVFPAGSFRFSACIMMLRGEEKKNPFRRILSYYWNKYGYSHAAGLPKCHKLMEYVHRTYSWAFGPWKDVLWQEFDLQGKRVGGAQMIVIARQSPNYGKPCSIREPLAIWNQAWFSSLRSAAGIFRYALATGRSDLVEKACMTKELALSFPQEDGLFDAVISTPNEEAILDGEKITCGGRWENCYFGNSNRNPVTWDIASSPRHILDMSWTALQMLDWYQELEKDPRLLSYVQTYAGRLLRLQDKKGFFPAWLDRMDGHVLNELRQSPESAVSAALLLRLYQLTRHEPFRDAAIICVDALIAEVMPDSRWEDFETYWSCSRIGVEMEGKKYPRNQAYKQCSLSPFYMAAALRLAAEVTGEAGYLEAGERCLCEMMMFQSSFQPAWIPVTVVGGFGVMNCDAELNDARQSMFAEEMIRYGRLLHCEEYIQRGLAALRASFSMMYCPENPGIREQWEKRWPFLNEKDYGFMMENYGHDGYADAESLGIGEFTIFDWGNGAASEAVLRIRAHWPEYFE